MKKYLLVTILMFCAGNSFAGLLFPYQRLALKNLDEMSKLIKDKIKESRVETGDKVVPLKEALQAVFSRPNDDFMIEKILPPLRAELEERNGWERSVKNLVKEAIGALQNSKNFKAEGQVTYEVFLENLVLEMKPKAHEPFESSILKQIRDAHIELSKEALSERKLRMMKEVQSPSQIAEQVLAQPIPVEPGTEPKASEPKPSTPVAP